MQNQTSNPPTICPMRAEAEVKDWIHSKGFGFLHNPDPKDDRTIFVHGSIVPLRLGVGKVLKHRETVYATYVQLPDGRLRATKIECS